MPKAYPDLSGNVSVEGSKSISLSFLNPDGTIKAVTNSSTPFLFSIPMNQESIPSFVALNISNTTNNLLAYDGFMINKYNVSIHYQIKPNNTKKGYFVAMRFGDWPQLDSNNQLFDIWNIFCAKGKKKIITFCKHLNNINFILLL